MTNSQSLSGQDAKPSAQLHRFTLRVTNPSRRDLILTCHTNLTREDAQELVAIYLVLGYAQELLSVTSEEQRVAA